MPLVAFFLDPLWAAHPCCSLSAGYPPPQGYPPQGYQGYGPPPQGYPPPQGQGYQAYGPPPQEYGYAAPPPPGAPYGAASYGAAPYGAVPPAPHLPARPQQAPKPPQGFDRYDLEAQQAAAAAGGVFKLLNQQAQAAGLSLIRCHA